LQPPVEDYADLLIPRGIGIDFALLGLPVFLFVFQRFHSPSAIEGLPTDMPLCAVIPGVPFNQGIN